MNAKEQGLLLMNLCYIFRCLKLLGGDCPLAPTGCPPLAIVASTVFNKKPSSRPCTKSFLIFGHILVLKVSFKSFLI